MKFEVCNAILPMFNSGQNLLHPKRKKVQSLSIIIKNDWLAKGDVLNYIGRWVRGGEQKFQSARGSTRLCAPASLLPLPKLPL